MLTLFESRYALKGRYNIGNVGKTVSMSMLTLFELRYTLIVWGYLFISHNFALWLKITPLNSSKMGYPFCHIGKTISVSMLTLFESRYALKGRYNIGNVGKTVSMSMLTLFELRYTLKERYSIGNVGQTVSIGMLTFYQSM